MDIRVIDRSRHVTQVPPEPFEKGDDPFVTLDGLLKGQAVHTGQIEIECDHAFMDALKAEAKKSPYFVEKPADDPMPDVPTYKGVRIFVVGEPAKPEPAPVPDPVQHYHTADEVVPASNVAEGWDGSTKVKGTDHALPPLPKAKP